MGHAYDGIFFFCRNSKIRSSAFRKFLFYRLSNLISDLNTIMTSTCLRNDVLTCNLPVLFVTENFTYYSWYTFSEHTFNLFSVVWLFKIPVEGKEYLSKEKTEMYI